MTGQNGKKTISNTDKLRSALCSVVPVSLIMQLRIQQEVYLLVCLSPLVLAFQRFILAAARFFSAATMCDTALSLPKLEATFRSVALLTIIRMDFEFRGQHPTMCNTHVISTPEAPWRLAPCGVINERTCACKAHN